MMKPIFENRQIERWFSIAVILYGSFWALYCLNNVVSFILYDTCYQGFFFDRDGLYFGAAQLTVGILLVVFFRQIVSGIGYFATAGRSRRNRRWTKREVIAAVLVAYALVDIIHYTVPLLVALGLICRTFFVEGRFDESAFRTLQFLTLYFPVDVLILFYARTIAGWLLRRVERQSAKRERGLTPPPL